MDKKDDEVVEDIYETTWPMIGYMFGCIAFMTLEISLVYLGFFHRW